MKAGSAKSSRSSNRERSNSEKQAAAKGRNPKRNRLQNSTRKGTRALTEDEADILYGEKYKDEKGIPWEQVKARLDDMDR